MTEYEKMMAGLAHLPHNVLALGNPCRVVREITLQDRENYIATYQPDI